MSIYHRVEPPRVPLSKFKVPTALIQGSSDRLADALDVEWLSEQIKDSVVYRKMYELGHLSFALAKDMTWFNEDVLTLINNYATNTTGSYL